MPWTIIENLGVCVTTIIMYLSACLLHNQTETNWSTLYNNLYFLSLTSIICVTASFYISRRRFEEFRLRYELNIRNKELAKSYEQLTELDRLKSEFFANVSHELRTPLTLIVSPIQELLRREEKIPELVTETLTLVLQNSYRLLKLINDLLELVRLEGSSSGLSRQTIDLSSFIPGLVNSVSHLARAKDLTLRTEGVKEGLYVQGDPDSLEKVMLNLLTNAIKFTPGGGVISLKWVIEDNQAIIEVRDTGIGIPAKELPLIFDRFHQVDSSSTRRFQGLGIGLSLARSLIEEHGGDLTADSREGQGTTFRIALPVSPAPVESGDGTGHEQVIEDPLMDIHKIADRSIIDYPFNEHHPLPLKGSGNFKILVVEDEPDLRRFLVSILSKTYRVLQAADGETGLAMVKDQYPDLVILDLMLPGMDGMDICQAIKSEEKTGRIKVVILTARMDEQSKIEALKNGADDFIIKPFSMTEIKVRLHNLLTSAGLERDLLKKNIRLEETLGQLKQAETQLIQSEKMNALGNIAAGIIHEINNPLNFMFTALQITESQGRDLDPDLQETLADIREGMIRIRDIVTNLRTFARPAVEDDRQCFDLEEVMETAENLTSHELEGISLSKELAVDCPVLASKNLIIHVMMNLLVNSTQAVRKNSSRKTPEIRIQSRSENGRLFISVRDNGEGIKRENMSKLFDPFFTTREVGEGMGLGLSICHTIVKKHAGKLSVDSKEGEWTEITFDLPVYRKES